MRTYGARLLVVSAVLAILALVALCLALLIRTEQSEQFRKQATHNCQQINLLKGAIRAVFAESQAAALQRDGLDDSERAFVRDYYARQRARFADTECM